MKKKLLQESLYMKKWIFLIFVFIFIQSTQGQFAIFSQFRESILIFNPAIPNQEFLFGSYGFDFEDKETSVSGKHYKWSLGGAYRRQWSGLGSRSPETGLARVEYLPYIRGLNSKSINNQALFLGAAFMYDQAGPFSSNTYYLRSGFRFGGEVFHINGGLGFSINQYKFDGDSQLLREEGDAVGEGFDRLGFFGLNLGILSELAINSKNQDTDQNTWRLLLGYSATPIKKFDSFVGKIYDLEVHHYILFGCIFNTRNSTWGKTSELMAWAKIVKGLPKEWTLNFRQAFWPNKKENRFHAWMGVGLNMAGGERFQVTGLYLEPSIVLNKTGKFRYKLGFVYNLYFLVPREYKTPFLSDWEYNFNAALGH